MNNDLISRQAVLDVLKDKWNMFSDANDAMQESIDTIESLRPVSSLENPNKCEDDKPCTECPQYDHEKHNCPHFCHVIKGVLKENPNKLGMWIERFDESGKWYECDQCHTDWGGPVNYCPNCGAKMSEMPTGSEGSDTE